jgi:membrane dipeptidase
MTADDIRALLATTPVFDGHNDLPWELRRRVRYDTARLDLTADQSGTGLQTDFPRLAAGGVGAQFWSAYVPSDLPADLVVPATLEQIDFVRGWSAAHPDRLRLATTADEVEAAHAAGRIASLIGMEGGHSIACSLAVLRMMYALGARYLTLTHAANTPWADSATDEPKVGGLSPFGHEVVREMNRLGMLVDLSHVATSTMHAALDTSTAPAFFSHSSARALCDHPRNVPDDVLARMKANGGVVMVTFIPSFVSREAAEWGRPLEHAAQGAATVEEINRLVQEHERTHGPAPKATLAQVADHVEHVARVAGADHVGIGSDFAGIPMPAGLEDVSRYPHLIAELVRRGWSDEALAKLAAGNVMRALAQAETAAARLQRERPASTATIEQLDRAKR